MFTRVALKSFKPMQRTYVRMSSIDRVAARPVNGCVEAGYNVRPSQQPRIPVEVAPVEVAVIKAAPMGRLQRIRAGIYPTFYIMWLATLDVFAIAMVFCAGVVLVALFSAAAFASGIMMGKLVVYLL